MSASRNRGEAIGYMRTSSATNVGTDTVSGADPVESRPGFAAMLARIAGNGVRTIIVETANRFARGLMVQEVGFGDAAGTWGSCSLQPIARRRSWTMAPRPRGEVAEFDKAMTVAKLKGVRDRKRRMAGKCEGRKSYAERDADMVALAKEIYAGGGVSSRGVAAKLEAKGYTTPSGERYSASAVASMLGKGFRPTRCDSLATRSDSDGKARTRGRHKLENDR